MEKLRNNHRNVMGGNCVERRPWKIEKLSWKCHRKQNVLCLCEACKISDVNIFSYRALQRERQLNAQLRESLDEERGSKDDMSVRERAAIADLQAMLDLERSKLLDLQVSREIFFFF